MKILVSGGAGYIGSHICVVLLEEGHDVIVADNLSNSKIETIDRIEEITGRIVSFYQIDVTDITAIESLTSSSKIDGVIHLAGLKAVGESINKPAEYYYNNVAGTMVLAKICLELEYGVKRFVFSSSATVYGENEVAFVETMELLPATSPYGESKVMSEKFLSDMAEVRPDWSVALLCYFNPVGAHVSWLNGEMATGIPNNLMPYIFRVARGELDKLQVFGDDYLTICF